MNISTSDLIYLNDAAKALKQSALIYNDYKLIGMDMIEQYLCYTTLDSSLIHTDSLKGYIFYAKDLSAFIKAITVETEFEIDSNNDIVTKTGAFMHFTLSEYNFNKAWSHFCNIFNYLRLSIPSIRVSIDDIADKLKSMHKADGVIHEIVYGYYITLFSGMLPLTKADKVAATFYDVDPHVFDVEYIIRKKKFEVYVILAYLKI